MKRKIKFRAWIEERGCMESVSDISLIGEEIDIYLGDSASGDWYGMDDVVLMEGIGVYDTYTGEEVFEGDIINVRGGEYYMGVWEFDCIEVILDIRDVGTLRMEAQEIRIIGNVFEDREKVPYGVSL